MLVSKKIPSGEESCKDFIAYLYNDNKVNLLHVMLPKTSAFVNSYDGQTKWMKSFDWKWLYCSGENVLLFGITSLLI